MIDKRIWPQLLLTLLMALWPTQGRVAEPLPPRALARIGDHRFYHGPGITCAVLSPDGKRVASAASDTAIVLWDAATGERLRELSVPQGAISRLTFSPDGKRFAVAYGADFDKFAVAVFEVETGTLLRQLGDFKSDVVHLQFSSDGKQLQVSESYGPVSAWDAATGKQLRLWKSPLPPPKDSTRCAARGVVSPEGRVIVWETCCFVGGLTPWAPDGLHVCDAKTDKLLYQKGFEPTHGRFLEPIAFGADGKRFATGYGDKLIVWETATGKEVITLEIPNLNRFALAPDARHVVIYEQSFRLRLWDIETGKPSQDLHLGFFDMQTTSVGPPPVFSADGKTLLLATDSTLRLFDTTTGEKRAVPGHRAAVTPRFSADGRTLFTSCEEKKCRWDISSAHKPALLAQEPRKSWDNPYLNHSTDDLFFLDRAKGRCQVRATATGRILRDWETEAQITPAGVGYLSPDASRVLLAEVRGTAPDTFWLYDVKAGKVSGEIKPIDRFGEPVFSPDARLLAWTDRAGAVHLHDAATGKVIRTMRSSRPLPPSELKVALLLFSPDGDYLFEKRRALPRRVFQVSRGREIGRFYVTAKKTSEAEWSSWMACSPDNRLLAVAEMGSGTIRLLEIASGKVRIEFVGHRHGVHGLAFAPDGQTLASGGEDNVVFLWDVMGTRTHAEKSPPQSVLPLLWNDLASESGKRAGAAITALLRAPGSSVAFLRERLHPAEAINNTRLAQWIADLDADVFETREAASRELSQLGERVEAALQRELTNRPSLEMRRRIEVLLDKLESHTLPLATLREVRAIEVLEHIGTQAARRCLETLAKGAPDARTTREAKAALQRLANCR